MRLGVGSGAAVEVAAMAMTMAVGATIAIGGCGTWSDDLACGSRGCLFTDAEWSRVASLAGIADAEPPADLSNAYRDSEHAITLGNLLYVDTRLSGVSTWKDSLGRPAPNARTAQVGDPLSISCATCHDPARYGSDFTSQPGNVSTGAGWYDVNGQQTLNAGFFSTYYWNGRTDTLWGQAAQVIESAVSMNGDRLNTLHVVASFYRDAYTAVFCDNVDGVAVETQRGCPLPSDTELADTTTYPAHGKPAAGSPALKLVSEIQANVGKAIAAYERTLRTLDAPFDRYVKGGGTRSGALGASAERGLKLFIGRASCIDCHNTALFSDQKLHDIGIPQQGTPVPTVPTCLGAPSAPECDCTPNGVTGRCLPWGGYTGALRRRTEEFQRKDYGDEPAAAAQSPDALGPCEMLDTTLAAPIPVADPSCKGKWRTPSLRDVAMTAPYMHDGIYATLSDVVWHYDQAEGSGTELYPLNLSEQDRDDLVEFLWSLTSDQSSPASQQVLHTSQALAPPVDAVGPSVVEAFAGHRRSGAVAPSTAAGPFAVAP
jgi:cytochrome c peroxidase